MSEKTMKHYLFVSDFDQTLTFNDSGYVLSEIASVVRSKPAMCGHLKTGHRMWPGT